MADADFASLPLEATQKLQDALDAAHTPTLLMVYVQLTGDEGELERFAPYMASPWWPESKAPPARMEKELRQKLYAILTRPGGFRPDALSPETMLRMMSVNVAEPVDAEYLPLFLEQMGFQIAPPRSAMEGRKAPQDFKVLVIGAGLTGIVASIKLAEAGYDHVLVEKNAEIGGTWFENRYPGVGIDTPGHSYSFSFEINPDWSEYHPSGEEMQAYLLRVAEKYQVRDRVIFNTCVEACVYDDDRAVWRVTVRAADGVIRILEANAIINGHGPLNRWRLPDIPGLGSFQGPAMHTANWDPSVDLKSKKVAVIGTGASAMQLVPAIAPDVEKLTVFQRSRHWVLRNPQIGRKVSDGVRYALRHIPGYKEWFRFRAYWFAGDGMFVNALKDPTWPHKHLSVSPYNDTMRQIAVLNLDAATQGRPDLYEKLLPDHPIFSKRILLDDGWFEALKRDNVVLENRRPVRIEPDAVILQDGSRVEADVLVLATGFATAKALGPLTVIGRHGANLGEQWGEEEPRSYLGVTVPGFPNFFLTVGPNSAPNHAAGQNMLSEVQINYIIECLDAVVAQGARAIEPKQAVFEEWNTQIEVRMQDMIWTHPKASSYYNNSKGRNFMSWPYRLVDYWNVSRKPDPEAFDFIP